MAGAPVDAVVALLVLAGAEDGLRPDLEPTDVTPGVLGFAVTALVVVGLIGLLLSMVVKLRRVNLGTERPAPPWAAPAPRDEPQDRTTPARDETQDGTDPQGPVDGRGSRPADRTPGTTDPDADR
ncbi:hypothetical protein [Actinotalea sp. Marseille-Q4924]|uniref:hypothetical protein n=1 Tax=Actinotalea sp. Marseille-Q4924 TaxID=2866571 RepID=UPI001CE47221|nr:hypothetical protein [Actinotalea sp. Marseille-Q4924]